MLAPLASIPSHLVSVADYQQQAKQHLDDNAWHYLQSGAEQERLLLANQQAFQTYCLKTKVLANVRGGHCAWTWRGQTFQQPIVLAPVAYQHLFHAQGEQATALAAQVLQTPFVVSSLASTLLEEIGQTGQSLWLQLYFQAQRADTLDLVRRAEQAGYHALVLTVDAPIAGIRHRQQRHGLVLPSHIQAVNIQHYQRHQQSINNIFDLMVNAPTWQDITWLREQTQLPLLLKGVLSPEDAEQAISVGVDGIIVSNHGGRVLDCVQPTLHALPHIAAQVSGRIPIWLDGGIHGGSDIFKALALGANAVLIGRPYIYALACAGSLGVAHLLRTLREELEVCMALTGCKTLADINQQCLVKSDGLHNVNDK